MDLNKISLPSLDFLEIMIINACNLSCIGCTTFSDLKHSGYVTWNQGRGWIEPWTERIDIRAVGVMGGEPLMNPDLRQWLVGIRELLPNAQIRFVTNGLLLHKNWWILDLLDTLGNSVLKISKHVEHELITNAIDYIFANKNWKPIHEFGIDRWVCESGLRFQIANPKTFIKTFRNDYASAMPHNSDPKESFNLCVQKKCPLLIDGKIWKCGTLALTPRMLERFNWPNQTHWEPFITPGLEPTCSDSALNAFINNFGQPHALCKQCPATQDVDSMINHTDKVLFK